MIHSKTGALPPNSRTLPEGNPRPRLDSGLGYEVGKRNHDHLLANDLLKGADAIAEFMGLTPRQIYERRRLPIFRLGAVLCGRKSTLTSWIEEQERRAFGGEG